MTALTLPSEIYAKFKALIDDENTTIAELCDVTKHSPTLSATLLNLVNSQFFGCTAYIDNIASAINLIGIGQFYDMIIQIQEMEVAKLPSTLASSKTTIFRNTLGIPANSNSLNCPC